MVDFLTRVSERALGVASVVQPVMGSRYAPTSDLSVPAIIAPEDRRAENPTERIPVSQSLSAEVLSSASAGQVMRPAPSLDAVETAAAPLEASALPDQTHRPKQSLRRSEPDVSTRPAENSQPRVRPSGEGLDQSPTPPPGERDTALGKLLQPSSQINTISVIADHANRAVNSGAIVRPSENSLDLNEADLRQQQTLSVPALPLSHSEITIDVKPTSHRGQRAGDPPEMMSQAEDSVEATEGRARALGREQSAPLEPPFIGEPIEQESSSEERLAPDRNSDEHSTPLRGDASLINQSITRGADRKLRSPRDVDGRQASSEKIIRVTIGRIEVRAVTPPLQPVESSAPPAPKLSLDEFLRQHNGRRR